MFWADVGTALSIMRISLAAAALAVKGTPEQLSRWIPEMLSKIDAPTLNAFCSPEPDAGFNVGTIHTRTTTSR